MKFSRNLKMNQRRDLEQVEPKADLVLLPIDSFLYLFPVTVTHAQIMDWSYRDRFPRAVRLINQKSEPLFERDAVLEWAREKYSATHPQHFVRIERALKAHPGYGVTRDYHSRYQPKFPVYNKKSGGMRLELLANATDLVRTGLWTWDPQEAGK